MSMWRAGAWLTIVSAGGCTFGFPLAPRTDASVSDSSAGDSSAGDGTAGDGSTDGSADGSTDGSADAGLGTPEECSVNAACGLIRGTGPSCPPEAGWMCNRALVSVSGAHIFGPNPRGGTAMRTTALAPFLLDAYEVSVARFRRYVGAEGFRRAYSVSYGIPGNVTARALDAGVPGPCEAGRGTYTDGPAANEGLPVNCVSFDLAMSFCAWDGGRLPTMAETELVRRWWPQPEVPDPDSDGRRFPWGDSSMIPAGGRSLPGSSSMLPVLCGFRAGCAWNIAGGVSEWQADVFSPPTDPCWSTASCVTGGGDQRTVMGGGWSDTGNENLPSAAFFSQDPSTNGSPYGFRCVYAP